MAGKSGINKMQFGRLRGLAFGSVFQPCGDASHDKHELQNFDVVFDNPVVQFKIIADAGIFQQVSTQPCEVRGQCLNFGVVITACRIKIFEVFECYLMRKIHIDNARYTSC